MATVVKCIVQDKKVVELLRLVADYVLDPPVVEPLDSGPKKPKVNITKVITQLVDDKAKKGVKTISISELREICKTSGYANYHGAYSYALGKLIAAKRLKKTTTPGTYEVLR